MKIQVLGSGCSTCKNLFELTKKAVEELELKTEVEYITDVTKIIELGVMSSPVLAVNGKPVLVGSTSDIEKIKEYLTSGNDCCKDCGDNCECDCEGDKASCNCK